VPRQGLIRRLQGFCVREFRLHAEWIYFSAPFCCTPLDKSLIRPADLKFDRPVFNAIRENQECNLLKPTFFSPLFSSAPGQNGDLRHFRYVTIKSDEANYGKTEAPIQPKSASRFPGVISMARAGNWRGWRRDVGTPLAEAHTGFVTEM
jgi:hypothetical protein